MAKINLIKQPLVLGSFPPNSLLYYNNTRPVYNPIVFSFNTEILATSIKYEGIIYFDVSKDLTAGTKILVDGYEILVDDKPNSIQLPSIDVTVSPTVAPYTSAYPTYFPSDVPNILVNKYYYVFNKLLAILNNNPNLNYKYDFVPHINVTSLNPAYFIIYVKAKNFGTASNPISFNVVPASSPLSPSKYVTIPPSSPPYATPPQGVTLITQILGVDGNVGMKNDELAIWLDVYVGDDNLIYNNYLAATSFIDSHKIQRLQKFWNNENIIEFDVSQILKSYTHTSMFDVSHPSIPFNTAREMVVNYAIRWGISYKFNGDIVEEYVNSTGFNGTITGQAYPQYWAIEGGIGLQSNQTYIDGFYAKYYKQIGNFTKPFLTSSPDDKLIMPYQIEYLYYIFSRDIFTTVTLKRKVEWLFEDGTTSSQILSSAFTTSNPGEIIKFRSSVTNEKIAIENSTEKKVKSYTIYLVYDTDTNTPISEKKTYSYHYDNECPNLLGEVYFFNELGGFDTIQINGNIIFQLASNRIEYSKNNTLNYSYTAHLIDSFDKSKLAMSDILSIDTNYTVECSTGYLPASHFEWLKQVINSKELYFRCNMDLDGWDKSNPRRCSLVSFDWNRDLNTDWYSFKFVLKFGIQLNERV